MGLEQYISPEFIQIQGNISGNCLLLCIFKIQLKVLECCHMSVTNPFNSVE